MTDQSSLLFVVLITAILMVSLKDVLFTNTNNKNIEEDDAQTKANFDSVNEEFIQKEIPTLKYKSNLPSMRFSFW